LPAALLGSADVNRAGQAISTDEPNRTSNPAGRRRTAASQGSGVRVRVVKKYGDDNGGVLVANLAYSGFVSLFPLLLVVATLGLVESGDPRCASGR
jgi:hypothetical protein